VESLGNPLAATDASNKVLVEELVRLINGGIPRAALGDAEARARR
jgi:hypothetical protein